MTSAIGVKQKGYAGIICGSLGFMHNNANNVYHNQTLVGLYTSCFSAAHGFSILPENFRKVIALFTARKSIKPNWINCKDEYLVPNTEHPDYEQWNNDCLVYSLFNTSSQQSSLRQITYKGKKWDIINHFFFMSNTEMRDLANDAHFPEMYQDAVSFPEDRYVYNLLQETTLSPDAQEVLEAAKALVRASMSVRKDYSEENLKYHLGSWDAGFAQLKPMLKVYFKEEYDAFVALYKKFENRMREGVYEFGFLIE